jgi:hypothetical protein
MFSSAALIGAGCATDEADDVSTSDDALLTCGGVHHNPDHHRGHHHHRHHHGHGGGTGMGGSAGHLGTGNGGSTGMGGSTGTGGSGGAMVDPRCVPVDGAVSWWHADGDFDDAVGANDGNNAGLVSFGSGMENQAFSLDGMGTDYVEVPDAPNLNITAGITIDAWINTSVFGGRIVDKATAFGIDGYLFDVWGDKARLVVGPDWLVPTVPIPAGIWTHVAATYDGTTMQGYLNGAPSGTNTLTVGHPIPTNANTLRIGADSTGGSLFNGMIDEPRVFNRALSAAEIQNLFWQSTNCQ